MPITIDQLQRWAQAPSETEETKCQRTVERIKNLLNQHFGSTIEVYLQGSYRNRTNVKKESDVDIVVEYNAGYYPDFTYLTPQQVEVFFREVHSPHPYNAITFKNDVEKILTAEFGASFIKRKTKCIKVLKNDYRVNADVIPCCTHKRHISPYFIHQDEIGIQFYTDTREKIVSFPKQHSKNSSAKNVATGGKYKDVVRTTKNIRYKLIENGIIDKKDIDSHLIECMFWNIRTDYFTTSKSYDELYKNIIAFTWGDMKDLAKSASYKKVHSFALLFDGSYNPQQAKLFLEKVWNFVS